MKTTTSHKIKNRTKANDIFITPPALALNHIMIVRKIVEKEDMVLNKWLDPCANDGSYFNQFPSIIYNKFREKWMKIKYDRCEILDGIDFFKYDKPVDVCIGNPPYSILDNEARKKSNKKLNIIAKEKYQIQGWLEKSLELKPYIISYLIGINNFTCKRVELMNKAGYGLVYIHFTKVYKWYGMSIIVVFQKGKNNIISYDRNCWR